MVSSFYSSLSNGLNTPVAMLILKSCHRSSISSATARNRPRTLMVRTRTGSLPKESNALRDYDELSVSTVHTTSSISLHSTPRRVSVHNLAFFVENRLWVSDWIWELTTIGGGRERSYQTILPLSLELGIKVDTSIDRDDAKGAAQAAKKFKGDGNVLICWEQYVLSPSRVHRFKFYESSGLIKHSGALTDIVRKLGVTDPDPAVYPSRFDIIWAVKKPYEKLIWIGSEHVPGLDDRENVGDGKVGVLPSTNPAVTSDVKAASGVVITVEEVPMESV